MYDVHSVIRPELVLTEVVAAYKDQLLERLAWLLVQHGCARETFPRAVVVSEYSYPTGLLAPDLAVAIPHADGEHCLCPAIAVATLAQPVSFYEMTAPVNTLPVSIAFMLCMPSPQEQIEWHRRLALMFQRPGVLRRAYESTRSNALCELLWAELAEERA